MRPCAPFSWGLARKSCSSTRVPREMGVWDWDCCSGAEGVAVGVGAGGWAGDGGDGDGDGGGGGGGGGVAVVKPCAESPPSITSREFAPCARFSSQPWLLRRRPALRPCGTT